MKFDTLQYDMKIFPTEKIKKIDRYTIDYEPIASIDLMERAASAITREIIDGTIADKSLFLPAPEIMGAMPSP